MPDTVKIYQTMVESLEAEVAKAATPDIAIALTCLLNGARHNLEKAKG